MSIGTKMRGVGESTYYTKLLRPQLEEVLDGTSYEMEHLLGKRKLVIHTDRVNDEKKKEIKEIIDEKSSPITKKEHINHDIKISWRDMKFKYAFCTSVSDMKAVNPDFFNDLTSEGEWVYSLDSMEYVGSPPL